MISIPTSYLCLFFYRGTQVSVYIVSFLLRVEPTTDCEAQNQLYLVLPISLPTFYLPAVLYYLFAFLAYGQHLARLWDRTLSVGPTITNVRANKQILPKITKLPFIQGGLNGLFNPLLRCRGYPQGDGVGPAARKVELVTRVLLPSPGWLWLRVGHHRLVLVRAGLYSQVGDLVWCGCLQGRGPPVLLQWWLWLLAHLRGHRSWELCSSS